MSTRHTSPVIMEDEVNMANATTVTHKAGSVTNAAVQAGAGIDYDKVDHLVEVACNFGFQSTDTPTAKTFPIAVVGGTGTIRYVKAWLHDTGTTTDIDIDLHKGSAGGAGSTVLSAAINLTNADTDATPKDGTISSAALADNDYLEAVLTVTTSTGAQGPVLVVGYSYEGTPT